MCRRVEALSAEVQIGETRVQDLRAQRDALMAKLEAFSGFLEDFTQTLEKMKQMAGDE